MDSISIIIPAYNEEARIPSTLEAIAHYLHRNPRRFQEVIVVDDGSTDGTAALMERFSALHPAFSLLRNPGNRGKGFTVRHGMLAAKGQWVLFTDADLSTPIDEVEKLSDAAAKANAAIAIGSRALDRSLVGVHQPMMREYSGRFFNLVMQGVTGLKFLDTQCGFKLFRQDAAQAIFKRQLLDGFGFDVEALFIARELNYAAVEVPVRWNDVAGTKVSLASGLNGFVDLMRVRRSKREGKYR